MPLIQAGMPAFPRGKVEITWKDKSLVSSVFEIIDFNPMIGMIKLKRIVDKEIEEPKPIWAHLGDICFIVCLDE